MAQLLQKDFSQDKPSFLSIKQMIAIILIITIITSGILMMTAREKGENFISVQAKIEAQMTGQDPCDILAKWLNEAKQADDKQLIRTIEVAEKFMGCRNQQKRKKR